VRVILLICGLLLALVALAAEAGMKAGPNMAGPGHHRLKGVSGEAPPLDGLTTPTVAISFRKLLSAYAGPAMRIRRASDNAELDVNFLGCSGFTGCPWDEVAAASHCAATNCFLKTGYDQSGGARHHTNAAAVGQPPIVFGCQAGLACLATSDSAHALAGPSITPATGVASFSAVANRVSGTGGCVLARENGAAGQRITAGLSASQWRMLGGTSGTITATAADATWHAAAGVVNGASSVLSIDGVETTGTATGSTTAGTPSVAGITGTVCRESEWIVWDNYVRTPAERAALIANQRSFFNF
jgi:hypothetical protein